MTKKNKTTKLALFAGAAALAALAPQVHAQSSDALIDKLVDKGILSSDEAKDLRDETDKDFKTAVAAKTGMPDWVTSYKLYGDFRGRFD
jgi:polyhydroxyalkanoate synthesis regulator phasin